MKTWEKWKKVLFLIICMTIVIRMGYVLLAGDLQRELVYERKTDLEKPEWLPCTDVTFSFVSEHNNLRCLEFLFADLPEDRKGFINVKLFHGDELLYETGVSVSNITEKEWKQIFVNVPMEEGDEYCLRLETSENCSAIPSVCFDDRRLAVGFGYMKAPGTADTVVAFSWAVLLLTAIWLLLNNEKAIFLGITKGKAFLCHFAPRQAVNVALEVLFCASMMAGSGIDYQPSTRIILYSVSVICGLRSDDTKKHVFYVFSGSVKRTVLYLLYVYTAFAFAGQRLLIYPFDNMLTSAKAFSFFVSCLWATPLVNGILSFFDGIGQYLINKKGQKGIKSAGFILLLCLLLLLPAVFNLVANNPAISSPDSAFSMIHNAKHLVGMVDWHPAFYCMTLAAIESIWDSPYAVILTQYIFWTYVMIECLLYLRKKGMKDWVLISIAAFCGFNTANILHINTIWKDIPYTLSLLWTLLILAKLSIDGNDYRKKWFIYFELVLALVGVFFYRKNGIVPFIVIVTTTLIIIRSNVRMWMALAASLLLIGIVKGPVYDHFYIEDPGRRGMYIGLSQDILGVYYANGNVSEETMHMINSMTYGNNAEYNYSPTWSHQSHDLDVEPFQFIKCYMNTLIRNPSLMLRAIVDREDALWDVFPGENTELRCVNYTGMAEGQYRWEEYYPQRVFRSISELISKESAYTASNQWIAAVVWRGGVFTLLGILSLTLLLVKKGLNRNVLLLAPPVGHALGLLLSTGWSDFRYFWPMNLMNLYIMLFVTVIISGDLDENALHQKED